MSDCVRICKAMYMHCMSVLEYVYECIYECMCECVMNVNAFNCVCVCFKCGYEYMCVFECMTVLECISL